MTKYLAVLAMAAGLSLAQQADPAQDQKPKPTVTKGATATKQDLETLRAIRKAVTDDKNLSTAAHNVHITVRNGTATLRGKVKSDDEKSRIEELAKTNGATTVVNNLQVSPDKSS